MAGLFGSIGIGISGLMVSRRGLETVSHNIANADNPAYTRQQSISSEIKPTKSEYGMLPKGTQTQQMRQIRDEFLDAKLRKEYTAESYWGGRQNLLSQVESIMNEKGVIDGEVQGGLGKVLDDFWTGWNELAKQPENMTVRGVLKERASALVTTANHMYRQLDNFQEKMNTEVKHLVGEVNKLTKEIAELNYSIIGAQHGKQVPNDLRDVRNQKIDRLSQILNISCYEDERNAINISLNGIKIVSDTSTKELECRDSDREGSERDIVDVFLKGESEPMIVGVDLSGGELASVLEARGIGDEPTESSEYYREVIPTVKTQLNTLVKTIADAINEIHSSAYNINGESGNPFFTTKTGSGDISAENIALAFTSLDDIATGQTEGYMGDGKLAESIANLRDAMLYGGTSGEDGEKTLSMEQYYRDMIMDLGAAGSEAINMGDFHQDVITQCENKRISMSGVSVDEEMTDMLKFQHAYSASARFINAIDEMLDVVINKVGRA